MKKQTLLILVVLCILTLAACSPQSTSKDKPQNDLIGKWQQVNDTTDLNMESNYSRVGYSFNADGTGEMCIDSDVTTLNRMSYKYTTKNNTLTLSVDNDSVQYEYSIIGENLLKLDVGSEYTSDFQKVDKFWFE